LKLKDPLPLLILSLVLSSFFHLGAMLPKDNAERALKKSRTDPISYKDKMEEIKDGEKGAPSPSMTFYQKEEFLTTSAVDTYAETEGIKAQAEDSDEKIDVLADNEVLNLEEEDEDWWSDEESGPGAEELWEDTDQSTGTPST
jgi:hypothetical protein